MSLTETRRQQNREAVKRYRLKNPQRVKEWKASEYQRNKSTYQVTQANYNATHREEINQSRRKHLAIPENRLAKQRRERERDQKARIDLIVLLGGKCVGCSKRGIILDYRALVIEHIHGGGRKERLKFKDTYELYRYYLANPELAKKMLQVMCHNCNHLKRYEKGEGCTIVAAFKNNPETSFKN